MFREQQFDLLSEIVMKTYFEKHIHDFFTIMVLHCTF